MNKSNASIAPVSTADLRRSLGEICDRVQYTGQSVIVSRKGREIVAIVPVSMLRMAANTLKKEKEKALLDLVSLLDGIKDEGYSSDAEAMKVANRGVKEVKKSRR